MKDKSLAHRKLWLILLLAAICAAFVSAATAQDKIADFSAGPGNGIYAFARKTPKTLGDLLKGSPQAAVVDICGHLFLPAGSDKAPAVVLMHGSGFTGERISGAALSAGLKRCTDRGASVGESRSPPDKAAQAVVAFLGKVLAR